MGKEWFDELERWVDNLFHKFRVTSDDGCITLMEADNGFYLIDNVSGKHIHLGSGSDFFAEEYPDVAVGSGEFYDMLETVVNESEIMLLLEV